MNPKCCRFQCVSSEVWLVLFLMVVGIFSPRASAAEKTFYRGFTIDESALRKMDDVELERVRAATREQIDIVCAVGLPEDILKFFQRVTFQLVKAESKVALSPGFYSMRTKKVEVTSRIVSVGHKPVLLHELLHAYHDQRVKGGYGNREILGFYAEGQRLAGFARTSHMLKNEKEYFACAGTTYLFGVTAQEPFQREKLAELQPKFSEYLKALFGPTTGGYSGSLTQ